MRTIPLHFTPRNVWDEFLSGYGPTQYVGKARWACDCPMRKCIQELYPKLSDIEVYPFGSDESSVAYLSDVLVGKHLVYLDVPEFALLLAFMVDELFPAGVDVTTEECSLLLESINEQLELV